MTTTIRRVTVVLVACALVAASCGGGGSNEPLTSEEALARLDEMVNKTGWTTDHVQRRANVDPAPVGELADALPPIDDFPLMVDPSGGDVVVEIFVSTEKSGDDSDGWMVDVAESFNASDQRLAGGEQVKVEIRKIASGIGYDFIASEEYVPEAFSPSNQLWLEMAEAQGTVMTPIRERTVSNVAGVVLADDTASRLTQEFGAINPATLIHAVSQGKLVMGYTDPFASSTGLNFLITVLDAFAEGDESRYLSPDVVSAFEEFQRNVPFVALTTLQIRESVEAGGTLDAFVMEHQTFVKTESLQEGYQFVPFGVAHNNPLYGTGDLTADETEALELFATYSEQEEFTDLASEYGFNPAPYTPEVDVPSGDTLIDAQQIWKEKKDGGRPVVAVFVADVSGSMDGSKILALQEAMLLGTDFITPETQVGLITFSDQVTEVLPVAPFDLNQRGAFVAAVEDMVPGGGTAMYDGVLVGLSQLLQATATVQDAKPILLVLTDGQTTDGLTFEETYRVIEGVRIPVYTVGFEADVSELSELSSLVEAASLDAGEGDLAYKLGSLFNAQL